MSETLLRVHALGLGKDFVVHQAQPTAFNLVRRILGNGAGPEQVMKALDGVDFDVHAGDVVGIIGNNGAGKSTLLKLIAGLHTPSRGVVTVRGRLSLVSGLGVGMLGDLTVHENVFLYGAICRMSRSRIEALFDEMIQWAELEEFVDSPLRHLSTGMRTRLGFAVAMHVDADVLLLDEALSAGDQRFKRKCEVYFESRRAGTAALMIASHELDFVEKYCTKALWLRPGEQVAYGPVADVVPRYRAEAE